MSPARSARPLVLIVDDDAGARAAIAEALRTGGYRVIAAVDGDHALEVLRTAIARPALIVTDLVMPVMSGAALIAALRRDPSWRWLPVIALTGISGARPPGLEVAAFLMKPFRAEELLAAVQRTLDEAPRADGALGPDGPDGRPPGGRKPTGR